jgi:hypothetical protein
VYLFVTSVASKTSGIEEVTLYSDQLIVIHVGDRIAISLLQVA